MYTTGVFNTVLEQRQGHSCGSTSISRSTQAPCIRMYVSCTSVVPLLSHCSLSLSLFSLSPSLSAAHHPVQFGAVALAVGDHYTRRLLKRAHVISCALIKFHLTQNRKLFSAICRRYQHIDVSHKHQLVADPRAAGHLKPGRTCSPDTSQGGRDGTYVSKIAINVTYARVNPNIRVGIYMLC